MDIRFYAIYTADKMSNALMLEQLTWPELDEVRDEIELVIFPLGATEQHGPNTSLATDTVRARALTKMIGDNYGNRVLIGPTLPIGLSYHHMKFLGTLSFSMQTYIQVIRDICWSLNQHNFKRVLFVTGHGGNKRVVHEYATEAKKEFDMDIYITSMGGSLVKELSDKYDFTEFKGHACEVETSQTMFLAPEHVRKEKLEKAKFNELSKYRHKKYVYDGGMFWDYKEVTSNGALGDATRASYDFGREMNELVLKKIKDFIDQIILKD